MDPFVAEIRIFGFNFAPKGWAFCNGQILPISQNTALFSLLGTTYGGDGKSTFALPNLQGMAPLSAGQGPGLQIWDLGESQGETSVSLLATEMPSHTHTLRANDAPADVAEPSSTAVLTNSTGGAAYNTNTAANLAPMAFQALPPNGGGQPHNNMQPYLTLNYCIALQGVFPPRS